MRLTINYEFQTPRIAIYDRVIKREIPSKYEAFVPALYVCIRGNHSCLIYIYKRQIFFKESNVKLEKNLMF